MPAVGEALAELAEAALEAGLAIAREEHGEQARAVPARDHRHGQDRRRRAQLRQRRRRHLRRRARRRASTRTPRCASAPRSPPRPMRACSTPTAEGALWPVDAALRPEGKHGPARAHHRAATTPTTSAGPRRGSSRRCSRRGGRPATGSSGGATRRRSARWSGQAASPGQLRRGRAGDAPPGRAARARGRGRRGSSSSGPGGLRDVEFSVQLLQLVHGRADDVAAVGDDARGPGRPRPRRLRRPRRRRDPRRGLPAPAHASSTASSCYRLRRTHLMPDGRDRPAPARAGHGPPDAIRTPRWSCRPAGRGPRGAPASTSGSSTGRCSPPSPGSAPSEARLSPEAARERLAALGFRDPAGALRHIEALTDGRQPPRRHPAHAAARHARLVRRRGRPRRAVCCPSAGSPTSSARRTGTSRCSATRARRPSGSRTRWLAAGMPPTSSCGAPESGRDAG